MKKDRKLRNELIEKERKAQKYLIKTNFDRQKGFLDFFHELNKLMFFKLSRNYEVEVEEFGRQIEIEARGFTWKDMQHLKRIFLKTCLSLF